MTMSRSVFIAMLALQSVTPSVAYTDDGRDEERAACMERNGNRLFCECRITVNPKYPSANAFAKIIFSQKCDQMFGHSLYH